MVRPFAALWLLPSLVACAARGGAPLPAERPASTTIAEVVNTAALAAALRSDAFVIAGMDSALANIAYDSTGAVGSVALYHPDATEADEERIAAVVRGHAVAGAAVATRAWFLIIRGDAPVIRPFEPDGEERPRLLNRSELASGLGALAGDASMRNRKTTVRLFLNMEGVPQRAVVEQTSGSIAADQALVEVAKRARFTPGQLGGFPISVWIRLPLTIADEQAEPEMPPPLVPPPSNPRPLG